MKRCCDCGKYPFCTKINKPSDEMCKEGIQVALDTDFIINREEGMRHNA
jgi:hypothetical protein